MKTNKTTLLLLLAALLISFSTQAKKKELRLNLEKGAKYEMLTSMNMIINQEMMGQKVEINQDMEITTTLSVEDKLENGNFKIAYGYSQFKATIDAMGQKTTFDTADSLNSAPGFKVLKELTEDGFVVELSPKGEVVDVSGFDNFSQYLAGNPQLSQILASYTSPEALKSNLNQMFNYFPDEKIAVGDKWETSQKLTVPMPIDFSVNFEVTNIEKDDVHLLVNSVINSNSSLNQNGMDMHFDMKGDQNGSTIVDANTGLMNSSEVHQVMDILMKMKNPSTNEDMEIPMKTNSTIKMLVNKL